MSWESRLMEYTVRASRTVEIRQVMMPVFPDAKPARRGTRAKHATIRKIMVNEQESVKSLARLINANFGPGDLWLVLKYSDDQLPGSKEEAKKRMEKFLRKCRDEYRKRTGKKLRYVLTTSDRDWKTGKKTRLHHHLVMDRLAWETLIRFWDMNYISYIIMDGRGDYTGIARYMTENGSGGAGEKMEGKKRWSSSKGLIQPRYEEPVPARGLGIFKIPAGAEVKEKLILQDEETGRQSGYIRYVLPRREVNRVQAPAPRRKGGAHDGG